MAYRFDINTVYNGTPRISLSGPPRGLFNNVDRIPPLHSVSRGCFVTADWYFIPSKNVFLGVPILVASVMIIINFS